jgi:hypothetical protein
VDQKHFQLLGPIALHGKGRLKSSNIVHGSSQISSRNFHVNGESNDSKKNVDEESKVLLVIILKVRMVKKALKTPDNNIGIRKSTRVKYLIQRLTYDGFVAHHYAYMLRVIHEVEQAVGNPKWDNAMDEEMAALHANVIWELLVLPKDKKTIGCNGCRKSSIMQMDL